MIKCTTIGVEPSPMCYEICILAYKCEALKAWERENTNMKALYRRLPKGRCYGCDHPAWCPSKKINAKRKCIQCRKRAIKRRASYNE